MRRILAAMLITLGAGEAKPETLAAHRWEARPVLVFAPSEEDPRLAAQLDLLEAAGAALRDRRVVVIVDTDPDSALRDRFRPDGFTVILVGLDGGEKYRSRGIVPVETLNGRIDAMPMRRRELRSRGAAPAE